MILTLGHQNKTSRVNFFILFTFLAVIFAVYVY